MPLRVLVVDDSSTLCRQVEAVLRQAGHEVMLADDGFDALGKVLAFSPDLMLCDIQMPRLDGFQTCALVRRNPLFSALPVVLLSSQDSVFERARARLSGACDFLLKPFTPEELLRVIADHRPREPEVL